MLAPKPATQGTNQDRVTSRRIVTLPPCHIRPLQVKNGPRLRSGLEPVMIAEESKSLRILQGPVHTSYGIMNPSSWGGGGEQGDGPLATATAPCISR